LNNKEGRRFQEAKREAKQIKIKPNGDTQYSANSQISKTNKNKSQNCQFKN
jgi:hypothetical protein